MLRTCVESARLQNYLPKTSNKSTKKCMIGDVRDIQSLRDAVTGDVVINLAAVH